MTTRRQKPSVETVSVLKTEAYLNFEANCDELLSLLKLLKSAGSDLGRTAKSAQRRVHRRTQKVASLRSVNAGSVVSSKATVKATSEALDITGDLVGVFGEHLRGRVLLQNWTAVLLLTLLSAYLEDGLAFLATKNPQLLKNADNLLGNDDVLGAASIEELRAELRQRWADKTLRGGGPRKWLPLLEALGAREYKGDCLPRRERPAGCSSPPIVRAGQ